MPSMIREQTAAGLWERLFESVEPSVSAEAARAILALDFPAADKTRVKKLAAKARAGTLSKAEQEEVEAYGEIGSMVSMIKSCARSALKKVGSPAKSRA
jgi:NAD-dependent DNA ligase